MTLSIDDFGTGYSSLNYLRRLPVEKLKIDQSFVRGLPESKDDAIIVRAIIEPGPCAWHTVIAEGVESEEQLVYLRDHGCDEGQGYFIRPSDAGQGVRAAVAAREGSSTRQDGTALKLFAAVG